MYPLLIAALFLLVPVFQADEASICENQCIAYFSASTETPGLVGDLVLFDPEIQEEMVVAGVTGEPSSLAWSPDQRSLVIGNDTSLLDLEQMTVETLGSNTINPRSEHGNYQWLPDGEHILLDRSIQNLEDMTRTSTLFLINHDGTNWQQLTPDLLNASLPVVSPDGSKVAFVGTMQQDEMENVNRHIYVLSLETGEISRLTDNERSNILPQWSSDGEQIAYISDSELHTMNADGSTQTRLTERSASSPQWVFDDTQIVYNYRDEAGSHLNMIEVATGEITTLRSHSVIGPFTLSPDGTQIVYLSSDAGTLNGICGFSLIDEDVEWCTDTAPHQATRIAWK